MDGYNNTNETAVCNKTWEFLDKVRVTTRFFNDGYFTENYCYFLAPNFSNTACSVVVINLKRWINKPKI